MLDEQGEPIGALGDREAAWHTDMSYAAQPPDAARPIRSASVDRHEPVSASNEAKQRSVARASDITASSFRFRGRLMQERTRRNGIVDEALKKNRNKSRIR